MAPIPQPSRKPKRLNQPDIVSTDKVIDENGNTLSEILERNAKKSFERDKQTEEDEHSTDERIASILERLGLLEQFKTSAEETLSDHEERITALEGGGGGGGGGDTPLYKVGLISDAHYDVNDSNNSEYAADITNAMNYFTAQGVDFIAACGDFCQYDDNDLTGFYNLFSPYFSNGLRLYACLGNHDYLRLYEDGQNKEQLWQNTITQLHCIPGATTDIEADINFFEYGAAWDDPQRSGTRNAHSKQNYWFERHGDIYVFLSVDYGTDPIQSGDSGTLARAVNLLPSNQYVDAMKAYVSDTPYDDTKEANFNYRFYDPEVLMWLKGILEGNTDKRVFIFSHHFFTHKSGNGNPSNNKWFYSQLRVWPHTNDSTTNLKYYSGANSLCGLEFWFLNKLNNTHRNTFWFTGHSHIRTADDTYQSDLMFCDNDYDVVVPTGQETVPVVSDLWSLREGQYDYKRYTRLNNTSVGSCAPNIHLPSLSKPLTIANTTPTTLYGGSEGMLMEVYSDKVVFKALVFKEDGSNTYVNHVARTKQY